MSVVSPFDSHPDSAFTLLADELAGGERLEIVQLDRFRLLRWGGSSIQSAMDTEAPEHVLSPTTALLLSAVTISGRCRRALNLGVGGASIERYLAAREPQTVVDSVEECAAVLRLVESYFKFDTSGVHVESADNFVARAKASYDVVFCDLFSGESQAPCVTAKSFLTNLTRILSPWGTVAFNLPAADTTALIATLQTIRDHFSWVRLAGVGTHNNVIAFSKLKPAEQPDAELEAAMQAFLRDAIIHRLPFEFHLTAVPLRSR